MSDSLETRRENPLHLRSARAWACLFFGTFVVTLAAGCSRHEAASFSDAARPQIGPASASEIAEALPPIAPHPIPHPEHAVAGFAVLADRSPMELAKIVDPKARARLVDTKYCGDKTTCDAVRAFAADTASVTVTIEKATAWGVPKADVLPFIAPGLSQAQRDAIPALPSVIVVSAHGPALPNQLPARAAFAIAATIAARLHAVVYDEALHRIETSEAFAAHAITSPLGTTAFREDRIVIQSYRQDSGAARVLTLGMRRFGAADVEIEDAPESAAGTLARGLDAIAAQLAAGAITAPLRAGNGENAPASEVGFAPSPHHEGDPDNTFLRVTTRAGTSAKGYADLAAAIDGRRDVTVDEGANDPQLAAAAARARIAFPAAVAKWRAESGTASGATLMVKLPFVLGPSNDASAEGVEAMWVSASTIDDASIAGTLANNPVYATSLHAGASVRGNRSDLLDYVLTLEDGGTEGGESMRILESRPPRPH